MTTSWKAPLVLVATAVASLVFALVAACDDGITSPEAEDIVPTLTLNDTVFQTTDWATATHSKNADPNFDEVFQDHTVKRIDIVVTEDRWALMLADMTDPYGPFGTGGGPLMNTNEDPVFVPAEVFYDGIEWYRVGVRFMGTSSLRSSWQSGILKLSFKMDFDEFEDTYPQIDNQRFFGFKKLSMKNNYLDRSMVREKVAGDVFRNAGLVASLTAFYRLYVDYGEGPVYFGVYTMVEEVEEDQRG